MSRGLIGLCNVSHRSSIFSIRPPKAGREGLPIVSKYSVLFKWQRSTCFCPSLLFVILSLVRNYHMRIPLWSSISIYTDLAKRIAGDAAIY
jgi:hypothetical protein